MSTHRFTISQGHMNVGVPGKACYCPIAVAICETLGIPVSRSQIRVRIMPTAIYINDVRYTPPGNVRRWIQTFDIKGGADHHDPCPEELTTIGPFSFWLNDQDVAS